MKKLFALLLVLAMLLCLVACGDESESLPKDGTSGSEENNDPVVSAETYDTGSFSVLVPAGWKAIPVTDIWAEEEGVLDPTALNICKGGETDWDLFSKPYVRIDYYGEDTTMGKPDKEWYDDGVDLEPFTTGSYEWTGFSATTLGIPIIVLWTEDGVHQYQITVYTDQDEGKISITDADVQAILESIALSN